MDSMNRVLDGGYIREEDFRFLQANRLKQYWNGLAIDQFSRVLQNKATCYKFYWLEAIIEILCESHVTSIKIEDVIDRMVANAWHTVCEYHLHMGTVYSTTTRRNRIEVIIDKLADISGLESNEEKKAILVALHTYREELIKEKKALAEEVPFHFVSPFFDDEHRKQLRLWKEKECVENINALARCKTIPYKFSSGSDIDRELIIDANWKDFFIDNNTSLLGWINYEKVCYLQKRNPEAKDIVEKLTYHKEDKRRLVHARKLWDAVIDLHGIEDIYSNTEIDKREYALDHFVPRQHVMNDELWNLIPTNPSDNSSKNNRLPDWDIFFTRFCRNQFILYKSIYRSTDIYDLFVQCKADNLQPYWGGENIYTGSKTEIEFSNSIEALLKPVYLSAKRQGFAMWGRE